MQTVDEFLLARFAEERAYWLSDNIQDARDCQECAVLSDHEPGRITVDQLLADVDAKRRIVQEARRMIHLSDETPDDGSPTAERIHGGAQMCEQIMDHMAKVYAAHPDYLGPDWPDNRDE